MYYAILVYFRPYDAIGSAWTMVFPRVIIGMLLFQITMAGLFILKQYITLAVLCVPLMIMTILFKITMDAAFEKNSRNLPMATLREHTQTLPTIIKTPAADEKQFNDSSDDDTTSNSDLSDDDDNDTPTRPAPNEQPEPHLAQQQRSNNSGAIGGDGSNSSFNTNNSNNTGTQAKSRWRLATAFAVSGSASKLSLQQDQQHQGLKHRRRRVILDEDDYEAIPDKYTDYRQPPMMLNPGVLDTGLKRYGNPALIGILPQLWLPIKDGEQNKPLAPSKRFSSHRLSSGFNKSPGHSANDLAKLLRRAQSARQKQVGLLDHHHCEGENNIVTVMSSSTAGEGSALCNNKNHISLQQQLENQRRQGKRYSNRKGKEGLLRRILLRPSGRGGSMGSIKEASMSQEHILQDIDEPRIREELHLASTQRTYDETIIHNSDNDQDNIHMDRIPHKQQHLFPSQYY